MTAHSKKVKTHYRQSAEILDLIADFENCTLNLSQWNQTTFLSIVFWYLYLNPVAEAEKLLDESLKRYQFENGLNLLPPASLGKIKTADLFRQINEFIKKRKNRKSFIELANLILESKEWK